MKALKVMIDIILLTLAVWTVSQWKTSNDVISDDNQEILEKVQKDITTDDLSDIRKTAQNDVYTSGAYSFTNLADEMAGKNVVDSNHDYIFNNGTDNNQWRKQHIQKRNPKRSVKNIIDKKDKPLLNRIWRKTYSPFFNIFFFKILL